MDAEGRSLAEQLGELLVGMRGGAFRLLGIREAEVVLAPAEHAEPLKAVDQEEDGRLVGQAAVEAALDFGGDLGDGVGDLPPLGALHGVRQYRCELRQPALGGRVGRAAVEQVEPDRVGGVLEGQAQQRGRHDGQRRVFLLPDQDHVRAVLPAEARRRGRLDGDRLADPDRRRRGPLRRRPVGDPVRKRRVVGDVRGRVALEDDRPGDPVVPPGGKLLHAVEVPVALRVGQPGYLERAVALDEPPGVVVDGLAGSGEELGRGVVVVEDQLRVRLAAL